MATLSKPISTLATEESHSHDGYTLWDDEGTLPTKAGSYYLTNDIFLSDTWTVPTGTVNLCLNGKTVMMQEDSNVILVPNGVTLNIYDCDESEKDIFGVKLYSGQIFSRYKNKSGITVKGTLNMYNGAVFGARTGVYVLDGTFNMYGGCVTASNFESEETNVYGGGVLVDGGTFTMDGGRIFGNRLRANGRVEDIFSFGAGVCVDNGGSFTMNGGEIYGNESHYGSGIYVKNGAFTMTDGEIHDNGGEGSRYGGGIYIAENCTAELTGGRIYHNTVHNLKAGAGIYSKGALSLGGTVKIENNRHDYDKGGISNLYFDNSGDNNKIIDLISPENGMHVGISMKNNTSFTDIIDQGVERYFFADNDNEYVEYNGKICVREMNGFNNIYKINIESGEHGVVYASVQAVEERFVEITTVYITVVPEKGYGIKSLEYNGTDITKEKSFAMINENVTVTAVFEKEEAKVVPVSGKQPTCTDAGYLGYFVLEEKYFTSEACTDEIVDLQAWKSNGGAGYIAPLDHDYEITYTWNGTSCTATAVCKRDNSHVETETVTGVYVKDSDATKEANEKGHYEATFLNPIFAKQVTEANSVEKPNTKLPDNKENGGNNNSSNNNNNGGSKGCLGEISVANAGIFTSLIAFAVIVAIRKKKKIK